MLYGVMAVAMFSLTLPATRVAVVELGATFVGFGRILMAAAIAALALALLRAPRPSATQWKSLAIVAAGVVLGFPLLTSWALTEVPASHGAVLVGLLPLATACAAAWCGAAWAGFAYVSIFSQFLGFVLWYRGLSIGGIARVSQVQLLQLLLTLGFSWALLGERVSPETILFALAVVATVWFGRRAPITHER